MSSEIKDIFMERTGTWIPAWVSALGINLTSQMILSEIINLHNSNGCIASNQHFATVFNLAPETVSRIISKLKKMKYIEQTKFDGRKRTLIPTISDSKFAGRVGDARHKKSYQTKPKSQSRIDQKPKTEMTIDPIPLVHKEQLNKNINIENKNWDKFLEWSRDKFSGSTAEVLRHIKSPKDSMPPTIQMAWENWA
jgi:hypothetical protein